MAGKLSRSGSPKQNPSSLPQHPREQKIFKLPGKRRATAWVLKMQRPSRTHPEANHIIFRGHRLLVPQRSRRGGDYAHRRIVWGSRIWETIPHATPFLIMTQTRQTTLTMWRCPRGPKPGGDGAGPPASKGPTSTTGGSANLGPRGRQSKAIAQHA